MDFTYMQTVYVVDLWLIYSQLMPLKLFYRGIRKPQVSPVGSETPVAGFKRFRIACLQIYFAIDGDGQFCAFSNDGYMIFFPFLHMIGECLFQQFEAGTTADSESCFNGLSRFGPGEIFKIV